jgi:hypothetical protein
MNWKGLMEALFGHMSGGLRKTTKSLLRISLQQLAQCDDKGKLVRAIVAHST